MNLLNPTTLKQQLDIYAIKQNAEQYLHGSCDANYCNNFITVISNIAPEISQSMTNDIVTHSLCMDTSTQEGINSYLRMFYLSLPFDTSAIREYLVATDYATWVRYFVNVILPSYIDFYRSYRYEH